MPIGPSCPGLLRGSSCELPAQRWPWCVSPCLASPGVIFMCERVRSSCPTSSELLEGVEPVLPFLGYSHEHGNHPEPRRGVVLKSPVQSVLRPVLLPSASTQSVRSPPLLFSSFFNLFKDISVYQEHLVQNTGSCNTDPWAKRLQ